MSFDERVGKVLNQRRVGVLDVGQVEFFNVSAGSADDHTRVDGGSPNLRFSADEFKIVSPGFRVPVKADDHWGAVVKFQQDSGTALGLVELDERFHTGHHGSRQTEEPDDQVEHVRF